MFEIFVLIVNNKLNDICVREEVLESIVHNTNKNKNKKCFICTKYIL